MEFLRIFLVTIALVALSFAGLAIKIIVEKKGRFPNIHIGSNKALKSRGITCAQTFDKIEQAKAWKGLKFKDLSLTENEDIKGGC